MKEYFYDNDCWYKEGCQRIFDGCRKTCTPYLEMNYMISNCGMPNAEKYIKKIRPEMIDEEAYKQLQDIKNNISEFVKNGDNLYIYSDKCGNGKTTWALKILYKYFDTVWNGNGFKRRGYFIYTPDFLSQLKSIEFRNAQDYLELLSFLKEVDLLVWDDIGTSYLKDYDYSRILSVIGYRSLNDKANIFTGNLNGDELLKITDNRLYDRIWTTSTKIEFKGNSRRGYKC